MKKILFITQNLARTGSEMVLWYLLNQLDPKAYRVHVLCLAKGELYDRLPTHIGRSVLYKKDNVRKRLFRTFLKATGTDPFHYQIRSIHKQLKPDFWYVNTIAIPTVYPISERLGVNVVTHFHELLHAYTFIQHDQLQQIIHFSKTCIACSDEVSERIIEMGHPDVRVQYSFIDMNNVHLNPGRAVKIREELGILPTDFVWVISGVTSYMKGLDYVIPILKSFKDLPVKIIWIGRLLNTGLEFYVKRVVEQQFGDKLVFTDALSENYYDYMAVGNGYLSLSREECLSLAMLEAAYLGLPIVSLDTGIASDFIKEGMGAVSKSSNIEDIVSAMQHVQQGRIDTALLKSEADKFTVSQQMDGYLKLLNELS